MYGLVFNKNDQISPSFAIEKFVLLKFTKAELTFVTSVIFLPEILEGAIKGFLVSNLSYKFISVIVHDPVLIRFY